MSRRSTSASRPTPLIGPSHLGGRVLPTGTVRLPGAWADPVAAGLRGRRNGGCRTPPRRCRPGSSALSPASASPISARRRAARRRSSPRPARAVTGLDRAPARLDGSRTTRNGFELSRRDRRRPTCCPTGGTLRRRAPRRALQRDRHDPAPSRTWPWSKTAQDIGRARRPPAPAACQGGALVKPGGLLVYCTCSLEPEEGEHQIEAFLARRQAVRARAVAPGEIGGLARPSTGRGDLRTLAVDAARSPDRGLAAAVRTASSPPA